MDWLLYDIGLRHERVNLSHVFIFFRIELFFGISNRMTPCIITENFDNYTLCHPITSTKTISVSVLSRILTKVDRN